MKAGDEMISISDSKGNIQNVDFFINEEGILQPLGLLVTRDSRYDLFPSTRDITDEVPGMHGEIDFGTEFKTKLLELNVATMDENYNLLLSKPQLKELITKYLDPTKGYKSLVFADDINKMYMVKYSGRITPEEYSNWFQFTIPFKMTKPFAISTFEKRITGNGTLYNNGTRETGLAIDIAGPVSNPSITIGTDILTYNGTLTAGQVLTIDTELGTAKIGDINAINEYNKVFPLLYPGDTNVIAYSNVSIRWRDKWI